jgi:fructose-1,6-bisphosphatase I
MGERQSLQEYLERYAETGASALHVAAAIDAIASACIQIGHLTADGAQSAVAGAVCGTNAGGDVQKDLDVRADAIIRSALTTAQVAVLASEEADGVEIINPSSTIGVAFDPLDGSSNIEVNMIVGTIFSIMPVSQDVSGTFRQGGGTQIAAGFVVYGPQTSLVLTLGDGVDIFALDRADEEFKLVHRRVRIPSNTAEFAINASNHRHWDPVVSAFIDQCLAGEDGVLGKNFNMRWMGCLVAEAYRILLRGGIFLYPGDARPGYADGRLRLIYEAHPIAFIMEQAGGAASTGGARILDLAADTVHQRTPLVMGAADDVRFIENLYASPEPVGRASAPLFARRGFFRV